MRIFIKKYDKYLRYFFLPIIFIVVGFVVIAVLQSGAKQIISEKSSESVWLIDTMPVTIGIYRPQQKLYGEVNKKRIIRINASNSGDVENIYVSSGEIIKKNSLLIRLNQQDYVTSVDRANSQIRQTNVQIQQAKINIENFEKLLELDQKLAKLNKKQLDRTRSLETQQNASVRDLEQMEESYLNRQISLISKEKQLEEAKLLKEQLTVRLQSEKANLTDAKLALNRSVQKSPEDALVTNINVQKGTRVSANTTMIELLPLDNLEITAVLIDKQLPQILESINNNEKINATLWAYGQEIPLQLDRLLGQPSQAGQIGVFKVLSQSQEVLSMLRPNITFQIALQRPEVIGATLVPYSALYGVDKVFVINESRLQGITVDLMGSIINDEDGSEWALIKSPNLTAGQEIMTTYLPNAVHGLLVEVR